MKRWRRGELWAGGAAGRLRGLAELSSEPRFQRPELQAVRTLDWARAWIGDRSGLSRDLPAASAVDLKLPRGRTWGGRRLVAHLRVERFKSPDRFWVLLRPRT